MAMNGDEEEAVLAKARALDRGGAYAQAAALLDELPPAARARPALALERARARMRQGRMRLARQALDEADAPSGSAGQRLLLALEQASLLAVMDVALRDACRAADAAFASVGDAALDEGERADAERVRTRIIVMARIHREVDAAPADRARDALPALAETLARTGRLDEALAALHTHADRQDAPEARLEAFEALAGRALASSRPAAAAEARLARARLLLSGGAPRHAIDAELQTAASLFDAAHHAHGAIDVRSLRAQVAIQRELADGSADLQACVDAYLALDFPRAAVSVLIDLSQLAHARGLLAAAAAHRARFMTVGSDAGLGLVRDTFQMAELDLLMRNGDYGKAIELAEAALATDLPAFQVASYEQLLAAAYSFAENHDESLRHVRRALEGFDALHADDSASVAAAKLAADLSATRRDADWDEADSLLTKWLARDEARRDLAAAIAKKELQVQVAINRFLYSPARRGDAELLGAAAGVMTSAEALADLLPPQERAQRRANLRQLDGQLRQLRGDTGGVEAALREAMAIYEEAGMAMEAANCRFLLGVYHLNSAGAQNTQSFIEAEGLLRQALEYYEGAGMRSQAGDACYMIAFVCAKAAQLFPGPRPQFLDMAMQRLTAGEAHYDSLRRDYAVGSVLEALEGKRAFIRKSGRIHDLALEILTSHRPEPPQAWRWAQRAKARALADALGDGSVLPSRVLADIARDPEAHSVCAEEQELTARLARAPAADRPALRARLADARTRMAAHPGLTEYLELRTGTALERADLDALLASPPAAGPGCVCVEWVAAGGQLFLLVLRPGSDVEMRPLSLPVAEVRRFVAENLGPASFRSTLLTIPELLRALDPLIAPLGELTARDELLICCPTGPLHAAPLAALELDGGPLIARNPLVFCPSLNVLRQCLARREERADGAARSAALFGDPSGDRAEAAALVGELAGRFGRPALERAAVTREAFARQVVGCDIVHFQGHARHEAGDPLRSCLVMADGVLSAREIFGLRGLRAELVTLGACESAATVIAAGDEPLGLIPAFLYAGARSVLATLWRVRGDSAASLMRGFYGAFAGAAGSAIGKAQALRDAVLALRDTAGFQAPYHWAPYLLYGDWL